MARSTRSRARADRTGWLRHRWPMNWSAPSKKDAVGRAAHTLEAYALEDDAWREIGRFAGGALVSIAPFEAVSIRLDDLWAPT